MAKPSSGPHHPPGPLHVLGWVLTLLSLAAILVLTLRPGEVSETLSPPGLCVICGDFGLANLLRNIVLFLPLGLGLGLVLRSPLRAALLPIAFSAAIETTQFNVPGRNPLLIDWLSNSTGAVLGVFLGWAIRGRLAGSLAGLRAAVPLAALSVAVIVGSAWSFQLAPPEPAHHVQWTPRLGQFESYRGRILEASMAGEPLPVGRHPDPAFLEEGLLGAGELAVTFTVGPPPRRLAPIFSVVTGAQRELFVLGARGEDLVLRLPLEATRLRLDRPDLVLERALAGVAEGTTVRAEYRLRDDGACLRLVAPAEGAPAESATGPTTRGACGLHHSPGEGWALLLFPRGYPGPLSDHDWKKALALLWLVGLGLLPGFFADTLRGAVAVGLVLAATAWGAPAALGAMAALPPLQAGALMLGPLAGWAATVVLGPRPLRARNTEIPSSPPA